jgi:gentisate 1,2-dioxygenase
MSYVVSYAARVTAAEHDLALRRLYADFEAAGLMPLWTQRDDLMPMTPSPRARPHRWPWSELYALAQRAGELVPVGRGGERRAIALANPGLGGEPYTTPTLWSAVQYLGPGEVAPAHRHSQNAFRFVLEGEGVWTVVDGDPVAMRRGDLLLTAAWAWHEHHNTTSEPMVWLDGLDMPLAGTLDAGFFEFGPDELSDRSTPDASRSEALWAYPGLRPAQSSATRSSPLVAYRREHTDAALRAQLELADAGHAGVVGPGHAAVRFTNPTTGSDALPTIRTEMHRLTAGASSPSRRDVGSSVWQVFSGDGTFGIDGERFIVERGDVVAIPSWCAWRIDATSELELFMFSDAPVYEALGFARTQVEER